MRTKLRFSLCRELRGYGKLHFARYKSTRAHSLCAKQMLYQEALDHSHLEDDYDVTQLINLGYALMCKGSWHKQDACEVFKRAQIMDKVKKEHTEEINFGIRQCTGEQKQKQWYAFYKPSRSEL